MRPTMLVSFLRWIIVAVATDTEAQTVVCHGSPIPEGFVVIAAGCKHDLSPRVTGGAEHFHHHETGCH